MIERQTLDGREATVAYLDRSLQPVAKAEAELIKVMYDDGEHLWLTPSSEPDDAADAAFDATIDGFFQKV